MAGTSRSGVLEERVLGAGWTNISSIHGGPSNRGPGERTRPAPEPVVGNDEIDDDMDTGSEDEDIVMDMDQNATRAVPKTKVKFIPTPITSIRTNILEELEHLFVKHRTEVVNPVNGFLSTPLHIVKLMADKHETKLHTEVYIIHHGLEDVGGEDRFWRVEIICGKARGIGQAPLRGLAYQLAAVDILEKIKYFNKDSMPAYGLPPGCRINPRVIRDLGTLCSANNLKPPLIEIRDSKKPFEETEMYYCIIKVGEVVVKAHSDSRHMARRLAALDMYNTLSEDNYPEMNLAIGNECVGLRRLQDIGIYPLASSAKREWLANYRTKEDGTITYFPDEEPDDGDMMEPSEVAALQNARNAGRQIPQN